MRKCIWRSVVIIALAIVLMPVGSYAAPIDAAGDSAATGSARIAIAAPASGSARAVKAPDKPVVTADSNEKSVTLSWNKVSGADGYQIYRATKPGGKYRKIKSTKKRSYTNKRLKTGKIYYYKVRAYTKTGRKKTYSKYCKITAVTLGVPVCKCSAMVSANRIRTNGVDKATGYAVYRANSKNGNYTLLGKTHALYFDDKTAKTGKVYYYVMRAYKKSDGVTAYGPCSWVAKGSRLLAAPKTTVALAADPADTSRNMGISVRWTKVTGAEGYEVWRSADAGSTYKRVYSGRDLSFIDKTCADGVTYYYKVRGFRQLYGVKDYGYCSPSRHNRSAIVKQGEKWLGYTKGNGKYKKIVDIYNNYQPLPRGMKGGYDEAWCTTFVTAASIKAGVVDIMPRERICRYMISLYEELGLWVEKDSYVPKTGDLIMYCWQDTGAGDCKQDPKHIGIVVKVSDGKIKVLEGNQNGKVAYRSIKINGKYIRGFATPDYDVNNGIRFRANR